METKSIMALALIQLHDRVCSDDNVLHETLIALGMGESEFFDRIHVVADELGIELEL